MPVDHHLGVRDEGGLGACQVVRRAEEVVIEEQHQVAIRRCIQDRIALLRQAGRGGDELRAGAAHHILWRDVADDDAVGPARLALQIRQHAGEDRRAAARGDADGDAHQPASVSGAMAAGRRASGASMPASRPRKVIQ